MYCTREQIKEYLGLSATQTADDNLLDALIAASESRIDSFCGRVFWANESTRRYNPSEAVLHRELWLDGDISLITSVINGDGADITSQIYTRPQNISPFFSIGLKTSATASWTYETDAQAAIAVTGRWAYMDTDNVTMSRASNEVTILYSGKIPAGASVLIADATDATFDGEYVVSTSSRGRLTYAQIGADASLVSAKMLYTPVDVMTATRRLTAFLYRQKDTQADIDRPILAGDGTVIMPSALPQDVAQILRPYVRLN